MYSIPHLIDFNWIELRSFHQNITEMSTLKECAKLLTLLFKVGLNERALFFVELIKLLHMFILQNEHLVHAEQSKNTTREANEEDLDGYKLFFNLGPIREGGTNFFLATPRCINLALFQPVAKQLKDISLTINNQSNKLWVRKRTWRPSASFSSRAVILAMRAFWKASWLVAVLAPLPSAILLLRSLKGGIMRMMEEVRKETVRNIEDEGT